ncbi:major facilitator superfamily domain-containing protein 1 isoform X2 [Ixodes scapularis]
MQNIAVGSTRAHRFIVLVFLCFLSFGSYYCSDNPGALQTQIENTMAIKTSDFSSLYSWYSWPNTVLCFLGGFLIDRVFGIRMGAIIFSTIIIVGQVVFALGALVNRFWLMQFGRFIFGVGRESLVVAQNAYSVCWFKGKELNTVFGLQLSISRLGSMANFMTMPLLFTSFSKLYSGTSGLGVTLLVAAFWCLLSMLCAVVLAVLDRRAARVLKREAAQTGGVVRLQDVRDFPRTFWMLCFVCVSYYVTLFPFIGLGTVFFQRKFRLGAVEANLVDRLAAPTLEKAKEKEYGMAVKKVIREALLHYTLVLCDGDSRTHHALTGGFVEIEKDCLNHVHKRMGSALRTLVVGKKAQGKVLGGKGRLAQERIKTITYYYGYALQTHSHDIPAIQTAVQATLHHMSSTDRSPDHGLCPQGASSWCSYNRAVANDEQPCGHKKALSGFV